MLEDNVRLLWPVEPNLPELDYTDINDEISVIGGYGANGSAHLDHVAILSCSLAAKSCFMSKTFLSNHPDKRVSTPIISSDLFEIKEISERQVTAKRPATTTPIANS